MLGASLPAVLAAIAAPAAPARAQNVYLNSPLVQSVAITQSAGSAKYRLSHTNFDQSLSRTSGTDAGSFISANLGNNAFTANRPYAFTLRHLAGQGLQFSMTDLVSGATSTLAWGSFSTQPTGLTAATLGGIAPGAAFNVIDLSARATRTNAPGSALTFSELAFTAPALTIAHGSFVAGTVTPATTGAGPGAGFWDQRLVADVNLADFDWALSGRISAFRDALSGGDESVRFDIGLKQGVVTFIPAPGPAAVLALAGFFAARRPARRHAEPTRRRRP